MKIVKYVLIGLGSIVALFLLLGLILPKEYKVERSTTISAPKDSVYKNLRSLKTFQSWSPWGKLDPNIVNTYDGVDGEIGSKNIWKGNDKVGSGTQELVGLADNRIDMSLKFITPFESESNAYYLVEGDSSSSKVTWGMSGSNPYPMNVMMNLFFDMDKMIGADYEKGLASLKGLVEKK